MLSFYTVKMQNIFNIHGVRGTAPVCGESYAKYGGFTTCFSVRSDQGYLIIDAGSGIQNLCNALEESDFDLPATILFTHFHVDHIIGLPFFPFLYRENATVQLVAQQGDQGSWEQALLGFMNEPYWPVSLEQVPANVSFIDMVQSSGRVNQMGFEVTTCPLNHTQTCSAYRLELEEFSVVVATDHEPGNELIDTQLIAFAHGADYFICDSQYDLDEFEFFEGHGHAHWKWAAQAAKKAAVGQLLLTHHSPNRSDTEIDAFVEQARTIFPNTVGAAAGMKLEKPTN